VKDTLLGAWALTVLALALALVTNHVRGLPVRPFQAFRPQPRYLTLAEARSWQQSGAAFLDLRPAEDYRQAHVPGALSVPLDRLAQRPWSNLSRQQVLVLYCAGRDCGAHALAAQALEADGYHRLLVMPDGWKGWSQTP
jgi:rhodanese-related sulfurtransferase